MGKRMPKLRFFSREGSLLIELMVATVILVVVLVGYLQLSIFCFGLTETTKNIILSASESQGKIEEMRNHNFNDIVVDYSLGGNPGNVFNLTQLNGVGIIYIDNTNPELLQVDIVASWREKSNRVIGEDSDLDGILDAGEDANGNGKLDSPVSLVTLITRR